MLPKQKRLKIQDFKGIRPKPVYRGILFDISTASSPATKYACIIAKKRIKRAVDRNTARRKVYALLQGVEPSVSALVFIYPTHLILKAPHTALAEEMKKAFATL